MSFILLGFSQEADIRHFAFQRVAADGQRSGCTVHADLPMARRFNIKLQDLPLFCRQILNARTEDQTETVIITEEEMRLHAEMTAASLNTRAPGKRAQTPSAVTPAVNRDPAPGYSIVNPKRTYAIYGD